MRTDSRGAVAVLEMPGCESEAQYARNVPAAPRELAAIRVPAGCARQRTSAEGASHEVAQRLWDALGVYGEPLAPCAATRDCPIPPSVLSPSRPRARCLAHVCADVAELVQREVVTHTLFIRQHL